MLPDADVDVDIDDLIDDDDNGDKEEEQDDEIDLDVEDLTTDEDEQHHPTILSSSSSSPVAAAAATERVDEDASAVATNDEITAPAAAAASSASDEDETNELNATQANEPQQQASIVSDDVTSTTGESGDVLPTTDKPQTEDADANRRQTVQETTGQRQSPEDGDHTNSVLAENRVLETCINEANAEYSNSVTVETGANELVCESTAAVESDDVILSVGSSAPATESATFSSLSTSSQDAEVVETQEKKSKQTIEDQRKAMENDTQSALEMTRGGTESRQNDENDQIDLGVSSQSKLQVEINREPASLTAILAEEDHDTRTTIMQKSGTVHEETTVDVEKLPPFGPDDEVTSQKVIHEEVKFTEEPKVMEQVKVTEDTKADREAVKVVDLSDVTEQSVKVTEEEVKVTYEASAKQLDLLSRLAMLREKAAQRKAQQASDDTTDSSTQDSQETTFDEQRRHSTHHQNSTGPLQDNMQQQHPDVPTKTDFHRRSVDTEIDRQTDVSTVTGTDREQQHTRVTGSPSHSFKSESGQLVSTANAGDDKSSASMSALVKPDDDTAAKTQSAVVNGMSTTEFFSSDKSARPQIHSERQNISTAKVLTNGPSKTTTDSLVAVRGSPTEEDAGTNKQLEQPNQTASCSMNADTNKLHGVFSGPSDSITKRETDHKDDSVQIGSTQAVSNTEDRRISAGSTAVAADISVQLLSVESATNQTDAGKPTPDNELRPTAVLHPKSTDSSGTGQLEPSTTLTDISTGQRFTATSVSTENSVHTKPGTPTHPPDDDDDVVNYDSDLDDQLATTDAVQLLADIQTFKSSSSDGPGYLYVFADQPRGRFRIGASRSPAKRLRQATAFNPDLTLLTRQPVSRRRAALRELRRRLLAAGDVSNCPCHVTSHDWFTGSEDATTKHVKLVAAAEK